MSYGKVQETFWDDPTLRGMSEGARILTLYLLTNRHRNRLGLYVLPPAYAAEDLQWDIARVEIHRQELLNAGRVVWDPAHRCVFIRHYLRHNIMENGNVVKGALVELHSLPDTPLLTNLLEAVKANSREHYSDLVQALQNRIANRLGNGSGNGSGNKQEVAEPPYLTLPIPNHTIPEPDQTDAPPRAVVDVGGGERMVANELVGYWLDHQLTRPPPNLIAKQGSAAKRLCDRYTRAELVQAGVGILQLFPHASPKNEPWDLFDLEKKFGKALQAAMNHPDIQSRRREAEIMAELEAV